MKTLRFAVCRSENWLLMVERGAPENISARNIVQFGKDLNGFLEDFLKNLAVSSVKESGFSVNDSVNSFSHSLQLKPRCILLSIPGVLMIYTRRAYNNADSFLQYYKFSIN